MARLSVQSAIIAMGQVLFRISIGGMFFKKTPLITTMMYRKGFAYVNGCNQSGMFSIGAAYPESSVAGSRTVIMPNIACC